MMLFGYFNKQTQRMLQDGTFFNKDTPKHDGYLYMDEGGRLVVVTHVTQHKCRGDDDHLIGNVIKFLRRMDVGEHKRLRVSGILR